jgi:cytochrome c
MKRSVVAVVVPAVVFGSVAAVHPAWADDAAAAVLTEATVWAFVKEHRLDCKACHDISTKIVGPAWRDVGTKYKGQNVRAQLIEKIKKGGKGVWGEVPMVAHPNVPDEVLGRMVDFEMSLGK